MPRIVVGRLLWGAVPLGYVALQIVVVAAWPVPYDIAHHTISDLGWTTCTVEQRPGGTLRSCSPRHALFNGGGVALWAVLAIGAFLLRDLYPTRRGRTAALALWTVVASFGIATSLVPGDVDVVAHSLLAVPVFVGIIAVLVLSAVTLRRTHRVIAVGAGVTAALSVVGLVGLVFALGGLGPVGLTERLAAETVYLWVALVALQPSTATHRSPETDRQFTDRVWRRRRSCVVRAAPAVLTTHRGAAAYRSRRDSRRSASGLPPV